MLKNILTEKSYKSYDRVSRYSVFPYYYNRIDNKYVYGITANLSNDDTKFVSHRIKPGDTLDSLALYYYNNPTYFWIIADFNRIIDAYSELKVGEVIKIPTFSDISYDL